MKRRLFEDLVVSAAGGRGRGGLALPASVTLHAVGVAALLALPAFITEALPDPPTHPLYEPVVLAHIVPPPPPPVTPPAPRPAGGGPRRPTPVVAVPQVDARPTPDPGATIVEGDQTEQTDNRPICFKCDPAPSIGNPIGTGIGSSADGGTGTGTGPMPIGGLIRPPTKVRDTRPIYPDLAKQVRAQGAVVIECIIAPDGRVDNVRVVSGHPLLVEPALDAVREWRYTPTLLNGVAVPVIMTVTVNFILS